MIQLSHLYTTTGKTTALIIWMFVGKVMSLLFNMLSRLIIAFLPRNNHLLILWLQLLSTVILEPKEIKAATVSTFSPSICYEVMGPDAIISPQGGDFIPSLICFPLNELIRPPLAIPVRRELYHLCHLFNSYSLEEGNGSPSQYSWLENSMDRRAWRTTVHGVAKSQRRLSN